MQAEIIKIEEVKKMIGVRSNATVYCKLNPDYPNRYDPSFPRPFKMGGGTFWKRADIQTWIHNQILKQQAA